MEAKIDDDTFVIDDYALMDLIVVQIELFLITPQNGGLQGQYYKIFGV